MRSTAPALLAAFLAIAGCSSSTGMIDQRTLGCEPGAAIEIRVGLDGAEETRLPEGPLEILVEVANNSDEDLTVAWISVAQTSTETARGQTFEPIRRTFDQSVAEGDEEIFRLPTIARFPERDFNPARQIGARLAAWVTVTLSNGDSYRCQFSLQPLT